MSEFHESCFAEIIDESTSQLAKTVKADSGVKQNKNIAFLIFRHPYTSMFHDFCGDRAYIK